MSYKEKVVVLVGSYKTIPPCDSSYPGIVDLIYRPVELMPDIDIKVVSLWQDRLKAISFDKNKYFHSKRENLLFRFIPYRIRKKILGVGDANRFCYYMGMILLVQKIKPTKIIVHVDSGLAEKVKEFFPRAEVMFYYHGSILEQKFNEESWKEFVGRIDKFVFICHDQVQKLEKKFGVLPKKYRVILNAIPALPEISSDSLQQERMNCRKKYGLSQEHVLVIYAGRITKGKNLHALVSSFIQAYRGNSQLRLIIAGDPARETYGDFEYFSTLKELSEQLPSGVIQFPGWLSRNDLARLYSVADIAVLLSTPEEGEGNSLFLMESMANGLACVATEVGGNKEVLAETGVLLPSEEVLSRLPSVLITLASDREYRFRLGQAALQRARGYFTYERVAKELREFIMS